ncbi:NusG domain II-containing protein [Cetobacterium sp.]|uniref:NusG domain II-containing protein n=1 Tax=Cetobacterium sp. TaxID=2071632 RepID=UPI002FC728DF
MNNKKRYFRKGDILIYSILILVFSVLGFKITEFKASDASNAEVYVNNELKYVYPLQEDERDLFVATDIGGVNIKIKDKKIRVTTSNSPLKLNVKQGWIGNPGEVIIGVPDRLIIKVIGKSKKTASEDMDFIIR